MTKDNSGTGLFIAIGMVAAALALGFMVKDLRKSDRYVTVKGLVERDMVADLAVWPLAFRVTGNDLAAAQAELEHKQQAVLSFLTASGLKPEEIVPGSINVSDRTAQEYGDQRQGQPRFILQSSVMVRSPNVQTVHAASQKTSELIRQGVALKSDDCTVGPTYIYTKLNEIKPEMLAEATKTARKSAEQFAVDSQSSVGGIRQANQGIFSISARDRVNESQEQSGGCGQVSDMNKRVRVVTTVDYYLN